jgi:hypothetical protein
LSGCGEAFGEAAFAARGGVFMNHAFGGGAVNDAGCGFDVDGFDGFLDFGFDARFDDLIGHFALSVLAQALFG